MCSSIVPQQKKRKNCVIFYLYKSSPLQFRIELSKPALLQKKKKKNHPDHSDYGKTLIFKLISI